MSGSIQKIGLSILLLLVAFLLYGGANDHSRLFGEDGLIWRNPAVGGGKILEALQGRWEAGNIYQSWEKGEFRAQARPVPTLVRTAEHALCGYDRARYQRDQIALHGIAAIFVFLLLARWLGSVLAGILGGLLFVAHPATSHTVLYLGGSAEILCAIFFIGTLLALGDRRTSIGRGRLWAIGVLALLSMLSKETGLLLPVVVLGVVLGERPGRARAIRLCLPIAVATVVAVAYRLIAIASIDEAIRRIPAVDPTSGLPLFPLVLQSVAGIAVEFSVLVLPLRLSHDYSWLFLLRGAPLYVLAGLSVALVFGSYLLAHRRGESFPRTPLVLLGLLPLLLPALIPDRVGTFASERHLYLALPGWIGLLLLLGRWLGEKKESILPVLAGLAVGVALLLGIRTALRVDDFRDQDTLLQAAQQSYPHNPQTLTDLGNQKLARGDYEGAIQFYEQALELDPYQPIALVNLASAYIVQEEWGLALRALDRAALPSKHVRALRMIDAKAHYAAGRVLLQQDRNREAALAFERVLLFYPEHLGALGNLGLIYVKAPHYVERGIEYLNYALERETNPERSAVLQKALDGAREHMDWYLNEYGVPPSEREPASEGAIGKPWEEVAAEGM